MISKEDFQREAKEALRKALSEVSTEDRLERVNALIEKIVTEQAATASSTISQLIETVEAKSQELAQSVEENNSLKQRVEEVLARTKELEELFAAKEAELKELQDKASLAQEELSKITMERKLEVRVAELASAGFLKSGEKLEAQKAKVRIMGDEEFTAYLSELADLRELVESALKDKQAEVENTEDAVDVPPADLDKETASQADLVVEDKVGKENKSARVAELMTDFMKLRK